MGGAARAVGNAVNATVNTVKDAVQTVVEKPLQGAIKIAGLPTSVVVDQAATLEPLAKGIPVLGEVTTGAGAASRSLDKIATGNLPNMDDLKSLAVAGGAVAGFSGDAGLFDFGSFLDKVNSPAPAKASPGKSSSNNYFIPTGGGFAPNGPINFGAIALFAALGLAWFFLLKGK